MFKQKIFTLCFIILMFTFCLNLSLPAKADNSCSISTAPSSGGNSIRTRGFAEGFANCKWVLISECAPEAWDGYWVADAVVVGQYKYEDDWCVEPCEQNCLGSCEDHTASPADPEITCRVESTKTYKFQCE
ncbi:MAG: hypothetical protein ABIK92_21665 [Pseudomonadota bacterium]